MEWKDKQDIFSIIFCGNRFQCFFIYLTLGLKDVLYKCYIDTI